MLPFHRFHLRVIALLLAPTLLFVESSLAAARVDAAPSITVRYQDLDLNSQEGVSALYGRIHAAAVDVCKSAAGPQRVNGLLWSEWDACISHSVADAVHTVHNEKLSAYHWQRVLGWKLR